MEIDGRVYGEGPVEAYQRGWDDAKEEASKIIAEHEEKFTQLHDDYAELLSCATGIMTYSPRSNVFKTHWDVMKRHVRDALKLEKQKPVCFLDNFVPSPPDWTPKEWQRILGASIAERDKFIQTQQAKIEYLSGEVSKVSELVTEAHNLLTDVHSEFCQHIYQPVAQMPTDGSKDTAWMKSVDVWFAKVREVK